MKLKNFFIALGKAFLYCIAFLLIQIISALFVGAASALLDILFRVITEKDVWWFTDHAVILATIAATLITVLFFFLFFHMRRKTLAEEVGFTRLTRPTAVFGGMFTLGFGLCILSTFLIALIPFPQTWIAQYGQYSDALAEDCLWLTVIGTVLCAPITEEIVFRGLVYTRLRRGMPVGIAALFSAVIFGILHGTFLHLVFTIPMGLLLCYVYEKYRSLWAAVFLHMGFNLCGSVLPYYTFDKLWMVGAFLFIGLYLTVVGFLSMRHNQNHVWDFNYQINGGLQNEEP